MTRQYSLGNRVESAWTPGAPYRNLDPAGNTVTSGDVLEIDPPRRLVTTFQPHWHPEAVGAQPSVVTWEIEPRGATCKLTVTHAGLTPGSPLTREVVTGWAHILSGLKTLLETGEPLVIGT